MRREKVGGTQPLGNNNNNNTTTTKGEE